LEKNNQVNSYKSGRVVLVFNGRMAGFKAVIIKGFKKQEKTNFESVLLLGIKKYPLKITRKMNTEKTFKKSRIKMFLKFFNKNHILPTRYIIDLSDIKSIIPNQEDDLEEIKQKIKESKKEKNLLLTIGNIFNDRFFAGKNKWFYKKLKF
jgi:large subunit ribosomal protein L27e